MQSDLAVRASWAAFYDSVRALYVDLVEAAQRAGSLSLGDARARVDRMLEAMEGLKLRAAFEPEVAAPAARAEALAGLMTILAGRERRPPSAPGRRPVSEDRT